MVSEDLSMLTKQKAVSIIDLDDSIAFENVRKMVYRKVDRALRIMKDLQSSKEILKQTDKLLELSEIRQSVVNDLDMTGWVEQRINDLTSLLNNASPPLPAGLSNSESDKADDVPHAIHHGNIPMTLSLESAIWIILREWKVFTPLSLLISEVVDLGRNLIATVPLGFTPTVKDLAVEISATVTTHSDIETRNMNNCVEVRLRFHNYVPDTVARELAYFEPYLNGITVPKPQKKLKTIPQSRRLTPDQVREIRQDNRPNLASHYAKKYGLSVRFIYDIRSGRNYADVQ